MNPRRYSAFVRLTWVLAIAFCLLVAASWNATAAPNGARLAGTVDVSLRPATTSNVQVGQVITLELYISAGTQEVTALDASIQFPAQYFVVVDASGNPTTTIIADTSRPWDLPSPLANVVNNAAGTIVYGPTARLGSPAQTGEFRVAFIPLKVTAAVPASGVMITLVGTNVFFGPGDSVLGQLLPASISGAASVTVTPNFSGTPTQGTGPLTVQFTDQSTVNGCTISAWSWNFGDGGTSTQQNPSYQYPAVATTTSYAVSLAVTCGSQSQTANKPGYITVQPAVTVTPNFSGTPTQGTGPLTVQFTDQSTVNGCTISAWSWNFGDGGTSTQQNPSYQYPAVATTTSYAVSLAVTCGSQSQTANKPGYITVQPPVTVTPNFSGTPTQGTGPLTVQFTDQSTASGCAISAWSWNFGDGGTSTQQNPSHQYPAVATTTSYAVSLAVTCGSQSQTANKPGYITVQPPVTVTPNFSGTPTQGTGPLTVQFTDQSTASGCAISAWSWNFGDGGTSTQQNPSHQYPAVATTTSYAVSLAVTCGSQSQTANKPGYITVSSEPVTPTVTADFSANPTQGIGPLTVQFTDQSTASGCAISAWSWNFGDGGTSTQQNPTREYGGVVVDTRYDVSLTATCGTSASSTATKGAFINILAPSSPPISVPEPATVLLVGSGLAGLAGYIQRRRKQS